MWLLNYFYKVIVEGRLIYYYASVLFLTILPGYFLYSIIFKNRDREFLEAILYSYFLGVFINFLIYLIYFYCKIRIIVLLLNIVICLVLFIICKNFKIGLIINRNIHKSFKYNFVFIIVLSVIFLFYLYPVKNMVIYEDFVFNFKNVNSLSHGVSSDFSILGIEFRYHLFNELSYAYHKIITGCESYYIYMFGQLLIIPLLLTSAIHLIAKRFQKNNYILLIILLNAVIFFGKTSLISCVYFEAFISNERAVGVSAILEIVLLILFIDNIIKSDKINGDRIVFYIFFLMLTGFKGPYAISLLFGITIMYTYLFVIKKIHYKFFLFDLIICYMIFALIYLFVIYQKSTLSVVKLNFSNIGSIINLDRIVNKICSYLSSCIGLFGARVFVFPLYVLASFGFTFAIAFISLLNSGKLDDVNIYFILNFLIGIGATYMFDIGGYSQLYFQYYAIVPLMYIIAYNVEHFRIDNYKILYVPICFMIFVSFIMFSKDICNNLNKSSSVWNNIVVNNGVYINKKIVNNYVGNNADEFPNTSEYFITNNEIEGLKFIKYNTNSNCVFATNRHYFRNSKLACYYYDTAYSDRQAYIEAWHYSNRPMFNQFILKAEENDNLFTTKLAEKEKYAYCKAHGIDILICHLNHINNYVVESDYFKYIYKNEEIAVLRRVD